MSFFYTCPTLVQICILVPNSYPMLEILKQHNQHQIKVKAQKTMNGPWTMPYNGLPWPFKYALKCMINK